MDGLSDTMMVIIILAIGGATGAFMAIEDFDLLGPTQSVEGQDGVVREVEPLYSDGVPGECSHEDGECGYTDVDDTAGCGGGQGCC